MLIESSMIRCLQVYVELASYFHIHAASCKQKKEFKIFFNGDNMVLVCVWVNITRYPRSGTMYSTGKSENCNLKSVSSA